MRSRDRLMVRYQSRIMRIHMVVSSSTIRSIG